MDDLSSLRSPLATRIRAIATHRDPPAGMDHAVARQIMSTLAKASKLSHGLPMELKLSDFDAGVLEMTVAALEANKQVVGLKVETTLYKLTLTGSWTLEQGSPFKAFVTAFRILSKRGLTVREAEAKVSNSCKPFHFADIRDLKKYTDAKSEKMFFMELKKYFNVKNGALTVRLRVKSLILSFS